ncbi:MAG: hypothetical protein V1839_02905 [archaeon]
MNEDKDNLDNAFEKLVKKGILERVSPTDFRETPQGALLIDYLGKLKTYVRDYLSRLTLDAKQGKQKTFDSEKELEKICGSMDGLRRGAVLNNILDFVTIVDLNKNDADSLFKKSIAQMLYDEYNKIEHWKIDDLQEYYKAIQFKAEQPGYV